MLGDIVEGILGNDDAESRRRMEVCLECPFITHRYETIFGPRCSECGCILKFKVRSESKCPKGKW